MMDITMYLGIAGVLAVLGAFMGFSMMKAKGLVPGLAIGLVIGLFLVPMFSPVDFNIGALGGAGGSGGSGSGSGFTPQFKVTASVDTNTSTVSYDRLTKTFTVPITLTSTTTNNYERVYFDFLVERIDNDTSTLNQAIGWCKHTVHEINNEDTQAAGVTSKQYPVDWASGYINERFYISYEGTTADNYQVALSGSTRSQTVDVSILGINGTALQYLDVYEVAPVTFDICGEIFTVNFLLVAES